MVNGDQSGDDCVDERTDKLISITRLARELKLNRMYLSGLIDGMGVVTSRGPKNAKAVQIGDVSRIQSHIRLTAVDCS